MRIQRKEKFDYDAELARHMCAGCNKALGGGRTLMGYVCTMYNRQAPKIMREANECPQNYRRRRIGGKVRVGQGKGFQGGNR